MQQIIRNQGKLHTLNAAFSYLMGQCINTKTRIIVNRATQDSEMGFEAMFFYIVDHMCIERPLNK